MYIYIYIYVYPYIHTHKHVNVDMGWNTHVSQVHMVHFAVFVKPQPTVAVKSVTTFQVLKLCEALIPHSSTQVRMGTGIHQLAKVGRVFAQKKRGLTNPIS